MNQLNNLLQQTDAAFLAKLASLLKTSVPKEQEVSSVKFTKKELSTMPKEFQLTFQHDEKIVKCRYHAGLFHARYRREGFKIEIAAKTYDLMKAKFIAKLLEQTSNPPKLQNPISEPSEVLFSTYGRDWLKIKQQTTKATTYAEYERMFKVNLEPTFGHLKLSQIDRQTVQDFLFKFVSEGKHRTAEKLKLQLTCIFDMAADDFNIPSPMKNIVLPYYETKKGSALTKEEERELVEYCRRRKDDVASALLVLLYFGLRQSELASLRIISGKYLECETSKERLGREPTMRQIPFTPVLKRVMPYIDFDAAKNVNLNKLKSAFRRIFPNHHPHELRYTFITRCKECHVNPELVMLWDGHKSDNDVRTSKVDRGYTDYSEEYILSEAEKVDYTF